MTARSESFALGAAPIRVAVRLSRADLHVVPGEPGAATVELTGRDPDRVRVELAGTTLTIAEEGPTRFRAPADAVTVRVPPGTSLDVSLGVGDLEADVELDQVRVRTASGDVRIGEAAGRLEAKTASGDLRVERAHDEVSISTASGDVRVGHVTGSCRCTTASGDVVIGVADGDVSVRTASGDLRVARFGGRTLEATSVSGDAAVDVVPGRRVSYRLDSVTGTARTRGGRTAPAPDAQPVEITARSMSGDLLLGVSDP